MTLPKDILPQVTAAELDAFSTIGGEERLIAFVNRFRELERERIINAIESYRSEIPLDGMFDNIIGIDEVIALIRGEQK